MKFLIRYISLALALQLVMLLPANAQKKYEREYSLKASAVPEAARNFINEVFNNAKVHWYGEESLKTTTIEAKLKANGKRYSVEFTKEGVLEDVEILTAFRDLPDEVKENLNRQLKETYKSSRVVKTQTQWTGKSAAIKKAIAESRPTNEITINYELVVKAKKTNFTSYYEILCDSKGQIKRTSEIIQRNADNLIY